MAGSQTTQSPNTLAAQWSSDISDYTNITNEINKASSLSDIQSYLSQLETLYKDMSSTGDQMLALTGSNALSPTSQTNITSSLNSVSSFLGTYNAAYDVQNNFSQASEAYSSSNYSQAITSLLETWASLQTNAKVLGASYTSQYTKVISQSLTNVLNLYYTQQVNYAKEMLQTYNCASAVDTLENTIEMLNKAATAGINPSLAVTISGGISQLNSDINYINDNPNLCSESGVYTMESNAYEASNPYAGIVQQAASSASPIQYIENTLVELLQKNDAYQAQALLSDSYALFRQEGQTSLYNQLMGVI